MMIQKAEVDSLQGHTYGARSWSQSGSSSSRGQLWKGGKVRDDYPEAQDENPLRGNWALKADYMLSVVGFTVGLGNLWRFPYLVYKNGGGAFLIPYAIMMTFAGFPLVFLESALGQFTSLGPLDVWKVVPFFQGLGFMSVTMVIIQAIYYNAIIAYGLYYLFSSFQYPLPWADCSSVWGLNETCKLEPKELCNVSLPTGGYIIIKNKTCENRITVKSSSEIYWDEEVLHRSSSISHTGRLISDLVLCLFLAWILIFFTVARGIKHSGKVAYFLVTYPYLGLTLLLIRGATLEGANEGVHFYIANNSNISRLADIQVWKDAASQTFFSLSVALGGLMSLSSYNIFHNDCYSDSVMICVIDSFSSILAGFAIFTVLGHLAFDIQLPVSYVTYSGFGLAFIICPEAIYHLPLSPLWSVIFFSTFIILGLTSEAVLVEVILTSLEDKFPSVLRKKRMQVSAIVCIALFFSGLLLTTQAGIYWINLLDDFCFGWGLPIIALFELICINWIYGVNNFISDIEMMCGAKCVLFQYWWKACWVLITPGILTLMLVWSAIFPSEMTYGMIAYPKWSSLIGCLVIIFCFVWIPIIAILEVKFAEGSNFFQRFLSSLKPASDWGPFLKQHRTKRYEMQEEPKVSRLCTLISKAFELKSRN